MPKIKWAGVIKDNVRNYQKNSLVGKLHKLDMPESMNDMMGKAIPIMMITAFVLSISICVKCFLHKQLVVSPIFVVIGILLGFMCVLIHEFLHAIVYPKEAVVTIGIIPKQFMAVALASYPLKRNRFILMCLTPYVLGIIPYLLFVMLPVQYIDGISICFGLACMGMISPSMDAYNVYQVLKQTPKDCKLQFYEEDLYWIER